jgi:hypothetical protein
MLFEMVDKEKVMNDRFNFSLVRYTHGFGSSLVIEKKKRLKIQVLYFGF